MSKYCRYTVFF